LSCAYSVVLGAEVSLVLGCRNRETGERHQAAISVTRIALAMTTSTMVVPCFTARQSGYWSVHVGVDT
jgi:hypothetical protein